MNPLVGLLALLALPVPSGVSSALGGSAALPAVAFAATAEFSTTAEVNWVAMRPPWTAAMRDFNLLPLLASSAFVDTITAGTVAAASGTEGTRMWAAIISCLSDAVLLWRTSAMSVAFGGTAVASVTVSVTFGFGSISFSTTSAAIAAFGASLSRAISSAASSTPAATARILRS